MERDKWAMPFYKLRCTAKCWADWLDLHEKRRCDTFIGTPSETARGAAPARVCRRVCGPRWPHHSRQVGIAAWGRRRAGHAWGHGTGASTAARSRRRNRKNRASNRPLRALIHVPLELVHYFCCVKVVMASSQLFLFNGLPIPENMSRDFARC
jgi:hypothetical protein